ncbi:hypothetical protein PROFUN_15898 [Planoprotostelium fungivorum]|uniref:Uncharacterized protein n=1 Tax=Planoprotostelium fungivorum TaxID=1890364 RepID=A0A2P6MU18_9EUKA|nr:hypothetical protein PROFUN_15898 [Planoprotostelium fungivorum]
MREWGLSFLSSWHYTFSDIYCSLPPAIGDCEVPSRKVNLAAVKKMLADNEQFQVVLDENPVMCCAQHLTSLMNWKTRRKVSENSATKKHIQCTFIEKEHLGFPWFEIILYKQRLIELFGSYVKYFLKKQAVNNKSNLQIASFVLMKSAQ